MQSFLTLWVCAAICSSEGASVRSSTEADSDYVDDFNFYDEFPDIANAEISNVNLPAVPLVLPVTLYYDIGWWKTHGKEYTGKTARQTVQQASLILQHHTLDIKIKLVINKVFLKKVFLQANQKEMNKFETILEPPFIIKGSPVTHIMLTATPDSLFKGIGRIGSVCSSKERSLALVRYDGSEARTAVTLAHEIGHILGMRHDFVPVDGKRGTCGEGDYSGHFIMNYGQPRSVWSECSNNDVNRLYRSVYAATGKFCLSETTEKVNCTWTEWSDWSSCSASCGGGVQSAVREVAQEAANGGQECLGDSEKSQECGETACPILGCKSGECYYKTWLYDGKEHRGCSTTDGWDADWCPTRGGVDETNEFIKTVDGKLSNKWAYCSCGSEVPGCDSSDCVHKSFFWDGKEQKSCGTPDDYAYDWCPTKDALDQSNAYVKIVDGEISKHWKFCSCGGCSSDQFHCTSGECIPLEQRCDFTKRHCPGGEDEAGCDFDFEYF